MGKKKQRLSSGPVTVRLIKLDDDTMPSHPAASQQQKDSEYLEPPYDLDNLFFIYENSSALRPNVDAYATNIDGFGFSLVDRYDDEDIEEWCAAPGADGRKPTEAEIKSKVEGARAEASKEYDRVAHFFEYASVNVSFVEIRKRTRSDLEVCGNAYWEVERDDDTWAITKIFHAPAKQMRLLPLNAARDTVELELQEQFSPFDVRKAKAMYTFRVFKQLAEEGSVAPPRYFKEFGDKRTMSNASGLFYGSPGELAEKEPNAAQANEIVHWRIYSASSAYGVPRWIGNIRNVLGSIEQEEMVWLYFSENGIPAMAILVAGSTLSPKSFTAIKNAIKAHKAKGRRGVWDILLVEAATDPGSRMVPKIELRPMVDARPNEAPFLEYDKRVADKIGYSFRTPRILRGDMTDFNRATANAAIEYAETQVFRGEREGFDWYMNYVFLPHFKVRYYLFMSNGPQVRDLENVAGPIAALAQAGVVTPKEGRKFITENTSLDLADNDEEWTKRPLQITLAGRGFPGPNGALGPAEGGQAQADINGARGMMDAVEAQEDDR